MSMGISVRKSDKGTPECSFCDRKRSTVYVVEGRKKLGDGRRTRLRKHRRRRVQICGPCLREVNESVRFMP